MARIGISDTANHASCASRRKRIGVIAATISSERPISTTWDVRNMRIVSTSELQRCTRSPVSAASKKLAGR